MENPLSKLPWEKAKLEETRHLLVRLEAREGEVSADRYQRLHERYLTQIDSLEKEINKLTDVGETKKIEMEDRLALQREKKREAESELAEIETLHEQGALDDETYRNQRTKYRRQARQAEKSLRKKERELDELKYYLTEVGEEPYRGNTLKGQLAAVGSQFENLTSGGSKNLEGFVTEASAEAQRYSQKIWDQMYAWISGLSNSQKWMLGGGIALTVIVVGIVSASGAVPGEIERAVFKESKFSAPISMEFPQESKREMYKKMKAGKYNSRGGGLVPTVHVFISDVGNIGSRMRQFLIQNNLADFETLHYGPRKNEKHEFMFYTDRFKDIRSELDHKMVETRGINKFKRQEVNVAHRELSSIDYTKEYEAERRGVKTKFFSVTFTYDLVNDLEALPYIDKTFKGKSTAYLDPGDGQWKLSKFSLGDRGIYEYWNLIEQN